MDAFLDAAAVTDQLIQRGYREVRVVPHTASTNADAIAEARKGAASGLVVLTCDQRAGRGRFDRTWVTPPDTALAMSIVVRPRRHLADWGWLSLLSGLAVAEGIAACTGLAPQLKWPNDVLIDEHKVCGILTEAVPGPSPAAIVGIGINVASTLEQLPVPTATSLLEAGAQVSGTTVAVAVLSAWAELFRRWDSGADVSDDYRHWCSTLGRPVAVHQHAGDPLLGTAIDVAVDGSLIVENPTGRHHCAAGDVRHLRPRL